MNPTEWQEDSLHTAQGARTGTSPGGPGRGDGSPHLSSWRSPLGAGWEAPPAPPNGHGSDHDGVAGGTDALLADAAPAAETVQRRIHMTARQRVGGVVIALACVAAAAWLVPHVIAADENSLVGTVSSTGVVGLNFASPGQIAQVNVQAGQRVHRSQVLATEYNPATAAVVQADKAAIAAAQAKIAEIRGQPGQGQQAAALAAAKAELARDQAQLASDQADLAKTRIVASSAGTIIAVNGQPGEAVTADGIRDYSAVSGGTPMGERPQFSLLPEGPQSTTKVVGGSAESVLPVVAMRISQSWTVVLLIPESQVLSVRPGRTVIVSVPAAHLSGIRGRIVEILPTPQSTDEGVAYQAVVSVTGRSSRAPLSGMSADVDLSP